MQNFQFNTPQGIRFGEGSSISCCNEIIKKLGSRIFFITDNDLMSLGLTKPTIIELEKKAEIKIFDQVESDPSYDTLLKAIEEAQSFKATGIIGFGGGSPMDIAKLVALILGSDENLDDVWGVENAIGPRLPLVLVPTTAGTGSEVTPISIITIEDDEKRGVSSPIIIPDLSILDPNLTIGLPPGITSATGIDAMVHAIEAYSSCNPNNNLISKLLSIEALKLLGSSIEKAFLEGNNLEARSNMLIGSMLAGKAFANSPVSAVHALAYPIGGIYHIPHGLSNALVLPYVLEYNLTNKKACDDYATLAPFIFPDININQDSQFICNEFIIQLKKLSIRLNLPQRLREVNIPENAIKNMASHAMKQTRLLINNPKKINEEDAINIYESAW